MTRSRRNTLLTGFAVALCCVALWAAYAWFEARYIRAFSDQPAFFFGDTLRLPSELAGPGPIRLVHFWDPACPCNVGNQQHLAELVEQFSPQGVTFYSVRKSGTSGQLPQSLSALQPLELASDAVQLPASPAVAIWGRDGQLAYLGPYSAGLTCTSSNSFIEPILNALTAGRTVTASNNLAEGCFCRWQGEEPTHAPDR